MNSLLINRRKLTNKNNTKSNVCVKYTRKGLRGGSGIKQKFKAFKTNFDTKTKAFKTNFDKKFRPQTHARNERYKGVSNSMATHKSGQNTKKKARNEYK